MTKSSTYTQMYDGDWFDAGKPLDLACCDCSLVHEVRARIKDGKVQLSFKRVARSTAQLRRHHKPK